MRQTSEVNAYFSQIRIFYDKRKIMIYACHIDREISNMGRMGTNISFQSDALCRNLFEDVSIWWLGIYSNLTLHNHNSGMYFIYTILDCSTWVLDQVIFPKNEVGVNEETNLNTST